MFNHRLRPLDFLERRVIALRYSINEPVVTTAELPEGPARAAIMVYLEEGAKRVIVVLRSLPKARVVQYEFSDDFGGATGAAFDAGLTFAESMGFLLDDECLGGTTPDARLRALEPLRALLEQSTSVDNEIEVDELPMAELETDPLEANADSLLSKFRDGQKGAGPAAPSAIPSGPGTTLGRVTPMRLAATDRLIISPRLRLLASL